MRSERITAAQTTRAQLARIDQLDGSLGAFRSTRHAAALAEAEAIDARANRSEFQVIEARTSNIDRLRAVDSDWEKATGRITKSRSDDRPAWTPKWLPIRRRPIAAAAIIGEWRVVRL